MKFILGRIPAAAALLMLAACGGGNSGSSDTPTVTPTSGLAVDGYLKQANVTCDANGNGVWESGAILRHLARLAGEAETDRTNVALDWRQVGPRAI